MRKRNTTIGYLPQTPELDEGLSAIDAILHSGSILARCVLAYERAIASGDKKVKQDLLREQVPSNKQLCGPVVVTLLGSPHEQLSLLE